MRSIDRTTVAHVPYHSASAAQLQVDYECGVSLTCVPAELRSSIRWEIMERREAALMAGVRSNPCHLADIGASHQRHRSCHPHIRGVVVTPVSLRELTRRDMVQEPSFLQDLYPLLARDFLLKYECPLLTRLASSSSSSWVGLRFYELLKYLVKNAWSVINAPVPSGLKGDGNDGLAPLLLSHSRQARVVETRPSR